MSEKNIGYYHTLEGLRRSLLRPDTTYTCHIFPASKYTEEDFSFIYSIDCTVDIKFGRGDYFGDDAFYIATEPKKSDGVKPESTVIELPIPNKVHKIMEGWCYLISDGEYQKIGMTTHVVERRISQIQNGNPKKVYLVAKYRVTSNVSLVESRMHAEYKSNRVCGEWFSTNIMHDEFIAKCLELDAIVRQECVVA